MSFYLDADDDEDYQQQQLSQQSTTSFLCPNCGGNESYVDGTSGTLCCAECFTQSQTHREAELDYEEVNVMAARTSRGALMGAQRKKRKSRGGPAKSQVERFQELDKSTPFPTLLDCIDAFQQVLICCIERLSSKKLLNLNSQQSTQLQQTVQRIWMAYLQKWQEGAEFYGKLHLEVRFSLRDCFLSPSHKSMILRYLSHEATKAAKKEMDDEEEANNDAKPAASSRTVKGGAPTIATVLKLYSKHRKGPLEAALRLQPSMTLAASILLLATSRRGICAYQMSSWIANGHLPLLNAYTILKDPEKMGHISYFFQMDHAPSIQVLELEALTLLAVARKDNSVPLTLLSHETIPLLTARIVQDLGFSQRVLDLALALMGRYHYDCNDIDNNSWLPAPLRAASHPTKVRHVLGILVVAVKLCPGWETWRYGRRREHSIPWNDDHLVEMKNDSLTDYLDFYEANYATNDCLLPYVVNALQSNTPAPSRATEKTTTVITLAGEPNPNQPTGMYRPQKHHDWFLRLRKRRAVWADANGLGDYVIYEKGSDALNVHPHYRLLLEHMAHVTQVNPSVIHAEATKGDQEMALLGHLPPHKSKKKKTSNKAKEQPAHGDDEHVANDEQQHDGSSSDSDRSRALLSPVESNDGDECEQTAFI